MGSAGHELTARQNGMMHAPSHPDRGLEPEKFREAVQNLIDLVLDYYTNVGKRQAYPDVKPGKILIDFVDKSGFDGCTDF